MKLNEPKHSLDTFKVKANYYVVALDGQHHYFPVKVEDSGNEHLFFFTRRPPILLPGIVCIGRKAYRVRLADVLRGRIFKSNIIEGKTRGGSRASTRRSTSAAEPILETGLDDRQSRDNLEPGFECPIVLDLSEAADASWQEQTEALLETLYKEEGIEWSPCLVQPEQGNEGGAAPDTDQDSQ